jgi:hypothetical protein
MDSKICHFWFTLMCNHPTMQDCLFFFLPSCLLACLLCFAWLFCTPTPYSCLLHLAHVCFVACLVACSHHRCLLPLACAIIAYFHHCCLFPLDCSFLLLASHLLPHASAIIAFSSTSLTSVCFATCLSTLLFACLTFELAPLAWYFFPLFVCVGGGA